MSEVRELLKIIDELRQPQHVRGVPKMYVTVSGCWGDVIGAFWNDKPRWERLCNSAPYDKYDAEWKAYFIEFETMDDLYEILTLVRAKNLRHGLSLRSTDKMLQLHVATMCHYDRDDKPEYQVTIKRGET